MVELDHIKNWMVQAGKIALDYYGISGLHYEYKQDDSVLTEADLAVEKFLRKVIMEQFPEHTIVGEEFDHQAGNEYAWILDPIDGTAPFFWNIPTWCISMGLARDQQPFMGFVYIPLTGDFYHSMGAESYLNGHKIQASSVVEIDKNCAFCISTRAFNKYKLPAFQGMVFSSGSGIFNNMLVARGSVVGALSISPSIWDLAAAIQIVTAAGGKMVYLDGERVNISALFSGGSVSQPVLAAPEQLVDQMLAMIVPMNL